LPFKNYSNETEEFFTDGMTDALITELQKISALRVISRTSVMQYKKEPKPLSEIAEELNVDAAVEGSVLRDKDKIHITTKLIQTVSEKLLWLGEDERHPRDVLALQKDVARAIADKMKISLTPDEKANLARQNTVNPEAYELYLQGHYLMHNAFTQQSFHQSIDYFLRAIEKDSSFAQAYAGLADSYTLLANYALLPPNEVLPIAKRYAKKGLELDETLAEVHTALGYVKMTYDWDWAGAEELFERAIILNPGNSSAYGTYAWFLAAMRRFDEAIARTNKARDLNPLSMSEKAMYGERLFEAGRFDEAVEQLTNALDSDPEFSYAHWILGFVYEKQNMYVEAINHHQKAVEYSGGMTTFIASLGHAYAISGKKKKAGHLQMVCARVAIFYMWGEGGGEKFAYI
jgi:TolB-like protein